MICLFVQRRVSKIGSYSQEFSVTSIVNSSGNTVLIYKPFYIGLRSGAFLQSEETLN